LHLTILSKANLFFSAYFLKHHQKTRLKKSALSLSEAMTIVILFHQSGFRFFKYFYCQMIVPFWKSALLFEPQ